MAKRRSIGKVAIAIIAIVIVIVAAVGGYEYYLSTLPKPVTMTIMVSSGSETEAYLEHVAQDFHALHPYVTIQIDSVGFGEMVETALTALKNKAPQPAIIMFYPSQAPDLAPYLANLEQYSDIINLSNMIYANMEQGGFYFAPNGTVLKVIGVPVHSVFGYVLGYQKSIFENQTLAQEFYKEYGFAFNPTNLTSWSQLYDIAEFINQTHAAKYALLFPDSAHHAIIDMAMPLIVYYDVKDHIPGAVMEPPGYYSFFLYVNGTWTTSFNNTAGVQALEMWRKLIQFEPAPSVQPIGYDQQEEFPTTGQYAMFIAWTSFIPIYNSSTSAIAGNLGIALLPGGMTGFAPTFLGINPYFPDGKLAAEFLAFALSDQEYAKYMPLLQYVPGTYSGLELAAKNPNLSWLGPFAQFALTAKIPPRLAATVPVLSGLFVTLIPEFNTQVYNYLTSPSPTPQLAMQNLQTAAAEWMSYIHEENVTL